MFFPVRVDDAFLLYLLSEGGCSAEADFFLFPGGAGLNGIRGACC